MPKRPSVWMMLPILLLLSACGHRSMVALVPDPDGGVGQITVTNAAGRVAMDKANQATSIQNEQTTPTVPRALSDAQLKKTFGAVATHSFAKPVHFVLHFQSDSTELLPVSQELLPAILTMITERMPTRVSVIGHTDTVGDEAYNVALSMRRAQAVRQTLLDKGVAANIVDVSSHGEQNLLIKTADNVANAENRRVEVVVR